MESIEYKKISVECMLKASEEMLTNSKEGLEKVLKTTKTELVINFFKEEIIKYTTKIDTLKEVMEILNK